MSVKVEARKLFKLKDVDPPNKGVISHYMRFKLILEKISNPENQHQYHIYPVKENPSIAVDYFDRPEVMQICVAFNACYCWLLLVLEKSWATENERNKKDLIVGAMPVLMKGVLAPLANFITQIGLNGNDHAGPTFEFYNFTPYTTPKTQVVAEMTAACKLFPNSNQLTFINDTIAQIPDMSF